MKKYFSFGLMMSLVTGACFAEHPRVTELIKEKQSKMEKLEKCQGTTKNLKIAGISTLGITAVGVGANIAEAVVLSDARKDIAKAEKARDAQQAIKDKRDCDNDSTKMWENGECKDKPVTEASDAGKGAGDANQGGAEEKAQEETAEVKQDAQQSNNGDAGRKAKVESEEIDENLPKWFTKSCAAINIHNPKGKECKFVDEPENPEEYQNQVAMLNSEKDSWSRQEYGYNCTLSNNSYICTRDDYKLERMVSAENVKCPNNTEKFDSIQKKCIQQTNAQAAAEEIPKNAPLKLEEKASTVKGSKQTTDRSLQQKACSTLGGTPRGNDCMYNKQLTVDNNLQDSVVQMLNNANLDFNGFKSDTNEYIIQAKTKDAKAFLQIRIPLNNAKCKDPHKHLDEYGQCVGESDNSDLPKPGNGNSQRQKKNLTDLCVSMGGTLGGYDSNTNNCRLEVKNKQSIADVKKLIENSSDATCAEYSGGEAVICNDNKGKSITITSKN